MKRLFALAAALGATLLLSMPRSAVAEEHLRLASTARPGNAGLLDYLNAAFENHYAIKVDLVIADAETALRLGRSGDVDVLLLHEPSAEKRYMADGDGVDRQLVMHSRFVIVGPAADPAKVREAPDAGAAFRRIAETHSQFVSRADNSSTYKKELRIWSKAGIKPRGSWYFATARGASDLLQVADQKQAYALCDRGVYLAETRKLDLPILLQGDPMLVNPYHVIAVNPAKHPQARISLARKYIEFLISGQGQKLIAEFRADGEQLFYPDAAKAH